jgi:hypothetical protein
MREQNVSVQGFFGHARPAAPVHRALRIWLAAAVGALWLTACAPTPEDQVTRVANAFVDALIAGDMSGAHTRLDDNLRSATPLDAFAGFLSYTQLVDATAKRWTQTDTNGHQARITGEVLVGQGQRPVPVRLSMEQYEGTWKISAIERGRVIDQGDRLQVVFVPAEPEAIRMAMEVTESFNNAVKGNRLGSFWSGMSERFRITYDVEAFVAAFNGFVTDAVDLTPALSLRPQLEQPATIDVNGELLLRGRFPSRPSEVAFSYRFLHEGDDWRLSGIQIELQPTYWSATGSR